jgi:hypothetical protein
MKSRCVPPSGGSVTELSVTEYCRGRGGDRMILPRRNADLWSILLTLEKLIYRALDGSGTRHFVPVFMQIEMCRSGRHLLLAGGAGILIIRRKIRKVVVTEQRCVTQYDCLATDVAAACDFRTLRPRCLVRTGAVLWNPDDSACPGKSIAPLSAAASHARLHLAANCSLRFFRCN